MGWDIKATADSAISALPSAAQLPTDAGSIQAWANTVFIGVALLLVLGGFYRLAPRLWKGLEDMMFSNWRLALLGTTGLVLSLASGWTTWDGMRNFTNEPLLSGMITFGIQGVMLIIAWLIGESFATGMSQRPAGATRSRINKSLTAIAGPVIGVPLFIALVVLLMQSTGEIKVRSPSPDTLDWWRLSDKIMIVVVGILLAALVALYSASDLIRPYLQSSRVIIKNAVLWVMFLACMATSVFFSFDSLFSAIFPQSERVRAAELRAQNQVAGMVADIGTTIEQRRLAAAEYLFQSEVWTKYDAELEKLATASRGAEGEIELYYVQEMEERRRAIAEQQERAASAQGGQAGLSSRKVTLTDELSRVEAERPGLAADLAQKKGELEQRAREVDAKRVEAMAEQKGVEGTLKEGRGPIYRQRVGELGKLQDYYKIGETRVRDAQKRVDDVNAKIDQMKHELAEIDGSLAKLQGEADTAQQRIVAASAGTGQETEVKIDPSRVLPAFEAARAEFRQHPDVERLNSVQQQCAQLLTAMTSTPATKDRVTGIGCDPKQAAEATGVLFALNTGSKAFVATCAGGDRIAQYKSADDLFAFARKCLGDSGLASKDTDELRTKINFVELNRDDKAHRFVVTWNAFNDGNRLAYLALAIAVAIDSLIFMSGLFAANAVRSPLSDVPTMKARSAKQLEAIIENSLLPDKFENAGLVLNALRPITNFSGFTSEVKPERLDAHTSDRVMRVLNAGSTIHAVDYDEAGDRYLVRAELFEFLSTVSKKAFDEDKDKKQLARLEAAIAEALVPDPYRSSAITLDVMHPIPKIEGGYTAEVLISEIEKDRPQHLPIVRRVLNAGAALGMITTDTRDKRHYLIHADVVRALASINARSQYAQRTMLHQQQSMQPIDLTPPPVHRLEEEPAPRQITRAANPERQSSDQPQRAPLDEERLKEFYLDELLAPVGLTADAFLRPLNNHEIRAAAEDSWNSLYQRGQDNQKLGEFLKHQRRQQEARIQQAYRALRPDAADDPRKLQILDSMQGSIDEALPLLMLHPQVGLLNDLIAALEFAAQPDEDRDLEEQDLLDRLRHIQRGVRRDNIEDPDSWRRIEDALWPSADQDMPNMIRGGSRGPDRA